mgnify:CR=1 FL=1
MSESKLAIELAKADFSALGASGECQNCGIWQVYYKKNGESSVMYFWNEETFADPRYCNVCSGSCEELPFCESHCITEHTREEIQFVEEAESDAVEESESDESESDDDAPDQFGEDELEYPDTVEASPTVDWDVGKVRTMNQLNDYFKFWTEKNYEIITECTGSNYHCCGDCKNVSIKMRNDKKMVAISMTKSEGKLCRNCTMNGSVELHMSLLVI